MRKPYKVIKTNNGEINIYGNHHWKEIGYKLPPWKEDDKNVDMEGCFTYLGHTYFLSEFFPVHKKGNFTDYDGYNNDSFFSGILIKFHEYGGALQAYTYII